jgi:pimeloyl-ACP methyl ester carboxylesterase
MSPTQVGLDTFAVVQGIRLHYVDWGGTGPVLLFLTGGGDSAHAFDALAPQFTDRFRVLGLTRRGQKPSDRPASGYDTPTLAADIAAFLDVLHLDRVALVGFSIAGDEETLFAGRYPTRASALIYLDAAYDRQSNWELNERSPFPRTTPTDPVAAALISGARQSRPDYSRVKSRALGIFAIPGALPVPATLDGPGRERANAFWAEFQAWIRGQMDQFQRGVRLSRVVAFENTTHGDVLSDASTRARVVAAMREFLLAPE